MDKKVLSKLGDYLLAHCEEIVGEWLTGQTGVAAAHPLWPGKNPFFDPAAVG